MWCVLIERTAPYINKIRNALRRLYCKDVFRKSYSRNSHICGQDSSIVIRFRIRVKRCNSDASYIAVIIIGDKRLSSAKSFLFRLLSVLTTLFFLFSDVIRTPDRVLFSFARDLVKQFDRLDTLGDRYKSRSCFIYFWQFFSSPEHNLFAICVFVQNSHSLPCCRRCCGVRHLNVTVRALWYLTYNSCVLCDPALY